MFKIIGGDRQEYGPVDTGQIRQWITEGRANADTRAQREGESEWQPLSAFEEFGDLLAKSGESAPGAPVNPVPPALPVQPLDSAVLQSIPELQIGSCLQRGWALLRENLTVLLGATAAIWCIELIVSFIPFLGGIAVLLLYGVLHGGLCLVFLKRVRGEPAAVSDTFSGFRSELFVQLMLAGVLIRVLSGLGYVLCLLPGIYLQVAWVFGIVLVIDKRLDFWTGMELSRRVVTRQWFHLALLLIIVFLPYLIMSLITSFTGATMILDVFAQGTPELDRLQGTMTRIYTLTLISQLVLLFTLPFATAALMYAYEDLFKARESSSS